MERTFNNMRNLIIFIFLILSVSCNETIENSQDDCEKQIENLKVQLDQLKNENESLKLKLGDSTPKINKNEDFMRFFWKFMTDSSFQYKRIKFPIEYVTWEYLGGEIDTLSLSISDWEYDSFYINFASERTQIYDNFDLTFQPTDERVLHWFGVETGGDAKYFFKAFNGNWYLISKEQLGD